jgi:hypothetical protein
MRLHPVEDGLIPLPDERGLRTRDKSGNRLIDVVDPKSGFCVGVRSPLDCGGQHVINPTPTSGATSAQYKPYRKIDGHYVDMSTVSELATDDPSVHYGLVVRLTTDGDDPLQKTRVRIITVEESNKSLSGKKSGKPAKSGSSGSVRKENDKAVREILDAIGWSQPVTPEIRRRVLSMLAIEKSVSGSNQ